MKVDRAVILIGGGLLVILTIIGQAWVGAGISIGLIAFAAFMFIAVRMPSLRRLARWQPLVVDILATLLAFSITPRGIIGWTASATVCVLVTVAIALDRAYGPELKSQKQVEAERVREIEDAILGST